MEQAHGMIELRSTAAVPGQVAKDTSAANAGH
jgi:hypothetical protein